MNRSEYLSTYEYRPFKNIEELKFYFSNLLEKKLGVPKDKIDLSKGVYLIRIRDGKKVNVNDRYGSFNCVVIDGLNVTMEQIFEQYVFYDESRCGVKV